MKDVTRYRLNLKAWITGFAKLDELNYFPGWNAWKFFPVYLLNHGTRTLTGGAVVTWSRWFYENREKLRFAKFMDRLLNKFDTNHGKESGGVLWDTESCSLGFQVVLSACFALLIYLGCL